MADYAGRKRAFLIGLTGFAAASAEADRAAGAAARAPWDEVVAAWDEVGDPHRLAHALIGAAEAAAADGDRPAAAAHVRRAADIADRRD